jgi:hypothetical protein
MDIQREMASLVDSGARFTIELNGKTVVVRVGDYLRQQTTAVIFLSFDDAVHWLHRHGGAADSHPNPEASH